MTQMARSGLVAAGAGAHLVRSGSPVRRRLPSGPHVPSRPTWSSGGYALNNNTGALVGGACSATGHTRPPTGRVGRPPEHQRDQGIPHSTKWSGKRISAFGTLSSNYSVTARPAETRSPARTTCGPATTATRSCCGLTSAARSDRSAAARHSLRGRPHLDRLGGSNHVCPFIRTSDSSSGTVDIKAICNWTKSWGWFGDVTIGNVQFGYGITSSTGGKNLVTNDLNITAS